MVAVAGSLTPVPWLLLFRHSVGWHTSGRRRSSNPARREGGDAQTRNYEVDLQVACRAPAIVRAINVL